MIASKSDNCNCLIIVEQVDHILEAKTFLNTNNVIATRQSTFYIYPKG